MIIVRINIRMPVTIIAFTMTIVISATIIIDCLANVDEINRPLTK